MALIDDVAVWFEDVYFDTRQAALSHVREIYVEGVDIEVYYFKTYP